jgi:hypothetical protein
MECKLNTATGFPEKPKAGIFKLILIVAIVVISGTFSFYQINQWKEVPAPVVETTGIVDKNSEGEMSAIRFTTLPFVLAFKHLVADRND